ncbi:hypothetical protein C9374_003065 [Naegleria lovaniensis]|uniref:Formate/nitrite transporter n=1 Tax=Naegleria lovaniensis TaxID=51637 RepID=A0AA88KM10_NAELO|nr:uncharacterized protein C9374_003065 [Naegleria lovaniensis]KAG2385916.1 hypothetical protein C9374_003065 [Naegleria lovaniensis]
MNGQASNTQPNIEALTQRLQFYEKAILALMSNSKKGSRMRRIEDELLGKESLEDHTIEAILSSSDQKKQEKKQKAEMEKQKILEEQKHDQEEERQYRCNPHLRQKVMTHTGVKKASKTLDQLIMLSLLGGVFIGFGSIAALKTGGNMPGLEKENPGLTKLIFSGVFTVGLTLVIITGAELFTGNTMTMMAAILRGKVNPWDVVRSWVVSLVFNLIGAWAVAYFLMFLPTPQHDIEEETQAGYVNYAIHLAEKKAFRDFWGNFVLAIGCNWLVCLAVYTTYGTSRIMDKLIGLFLPILAFVSSGFEHSIANGFFIPLAMMYGSPITMYDFLIGNMFPVVLGNTVGGGVFVGMVFWWVHGKRQERKHILDEWFLDKLKAKIASPFVHVYEKFQEKWNEYLDLRRINKLIKLQEREERAARMRVVSEFDDAEDMIA